MPKVGGQFKIPRRNFARFLLLLFIIWSLIIRTAYQSKMFEFLQADPRKPRVMSLADIADRNFTIVFPFEYTTSGTFDPCAEFFEFTKEEFPSRPHCVIGNFSDKVLDIVAEPQNKAVTFGPIQQLKLIHEFRYRDGISSLQMLETNYVVTFWCIAFNSFSPFYEVLNNLTTLAFETGLTKVWLSKFYFKKNPKFEPTGPQVLTIEHLGIGFLFCLVPLTISAIVFLCEITSVWVLRPNINLN